MSGMSPMTSAMTTLTHLPDHNHDTNTYSPNVTDARITSNSIVQQTDLLLVDNLALLENHEHDDAVLENIYKEECFDLSPVGDRFKPRDEELIVYYLARKIANQPLPPNRIWDVELYKKDPAALTAEYRSNGDNQWFFYTPRNRKYPQGNRPDRAAGNGFWKATGADKIIKFNGIKVGFRKSLVFHVGKPKQCVRTPWLMHEYRMRNPPKRERTGPDDMKLDDWVLCKVYRKAGKIRNNTEEKHSIDEYTPALRRPINEVQKQTPVPVPYETKPCNFALVNPFNQEQSLMLPNQPDPNALLQEPTLKLPEPDQPQLLNQMENLCSVDYDHIDQKFYYSECPSFYGEGKEMAIRQVHYQSQPQSQSQSFVPAPIGVEDQQIPVNLLMPQQNDFSSENQHLDHVEYDDQQTNVQFGYQPCQGSYENPQGLMRLVSLQRNMKYDCQQRKYQNQNFVECIHAASYGKDVVNPLSRCSCINRMLSCDNINDNNVDQFFDMYQNDSTQQPLSTLSAKEYQNLWV